MNFNEARKIRNEYGVDFAKISSNLISVILSKLTPEETPETISDKLSDELDSIMEKITYEKIVKVMQLINKITKELDFDKDEDFVEINTLVDEFKFKVITETSKAFSELSKVVNDPKI